MPDTYTGPRRSTVLRWLLFAFLALVILLPAVLQGVKIALLLLLVMAAFLESGRSAWRITVDRRIVLWFAFYLAAGAAWTTYGALNRAEGIGESIVVYIVSPLLYLALISHLRDGTDLRRLYRLLMTCSAVVAALVVLKVMSVLGASVKPVDVLISLYPEEGFATRRDYTPRVLATLVFLMPFCLSCLVLYDKSRIPWPRIPLALTLVGCVVASLISARNALVLVMLLTPLFLAAAVWLLSGEQRRAAVRRLAVLAVAGVLLAVLAGAVLPHVINWRLDEAVAELFAAFDPERNPGAMTRSEQAVILLEGVSERPLIGHGLGRGVDGYIRDPEKPWRYELRYLALAYHTGFLGLVVYAAGVLWLFARGAVLIRGGGRHAVDVAVMLIPLATTLVAEGTNPYLNHFGHLWMLFLPIAAVNVGMRAGAAVGEPGGTAP